VFISFISDARVVDFPEPTDPVTRTSPFFFFVKSFIALGRPRVSKSGILLSMTRKTIAYHFLCERTFALKRPYHLSDIQKSSSSSSENFFLSFSGIIERISLLRSSLFIKPRSHKKTISPFIFREG
jgi:hypothetical protein